MHHTTLGSVSGMGTERGRGGNSKGSRNRRRGKGRGNDTVENISSVDSPQVQQPAQDRLIKEALSPAKSCSSTASAANATALRGGSQDLTPTKLGSASEDVIPVVDSEQIHPRPPVAPPQRVGKPRNNESTASFQTPKSRSNQGATSVDSVTSSTSFTSKSSRESVQGISTLPNPTSPANQTVSNPVIGEGPSKIHCVGGPGCSGSNDCDGNTEDASPLTHPAKPKRKNKRRAKASHANTSDATTQPNADHLDLATTSNLESIEIQGPNLGDTMIVSSQSEALNKSGAHVTPVVVDSVVGEVPVSAKTEVPSSSALVNVNDSPSAPADISIAATVGIEIDSQGQAPTRPPRRRNRRKPKAKDSIAVQTQPTIEEEGLCSSTGFAALTGPAENTTPAPLTEPLHHQKITVQSELEPGPVKSEDTKENVDPGAPIVDSGTGKGGVKRRRARGRRQNKTEVATRCDDAKTPVHAVSTDGEVDINNCKQKVVPQGPEQKPAQRSQYQHFIPCLVLRTFATAEARALGGRRNALMNVYSMEDACITPTPVGRCYGYPNMYQDVSGADEMHVEKALSVLENLAARAIERIKREQAKGSSSVTLTRAERNNIRKFLFVMKYRGSGFWVKYNRTLEEYQHLDRELLLEFMHKRGFTKPIEVWLHNLRTILDTPIDPKDEWENTILETCFSLDGRWFIINMNNFFMAFVQPSNPHNEFIITDSAFGIHEGPTFAPITTEAPLHAGKTSEFSSEMLQLRNETMFGNSRFTEFHKMAPFSPKLLLVLRSHHLANKESKRRKQELEDLLSGPDSHDWRSPSVFDKLHLDLPKPTYVVDYENRTNEDTFEFTLHKISDQDVWLFNSIFLDNVKRNMTWHSDAALKRTLMEYLDAEKFLQPLEFAIALGEEGMQRHPAINRREQLYRLLAILEGHRGRGMELPVPPLSSHINKMLEFEGKQSQNPRLQGYYKLGMFPFIYFFQSDYLALPILLNYGKIQFLLVYVVHTQA